MNTEPRLTRAEDGSYTELTPNGMQIGGSSSSAPICRKVGGGWVVVAMGLAPEEMSSAAVSG